MSFAKTVVFKNNYIIKYKIFMLYELDVCSSDSVVLFFNVQP